MLNFPDKLYKQKDLMQDEGFLFCELPPSSRQAGEVRVCCSLFGEELQRAVGGGNLAHRVAASLRESRRGRLVVDVDAVVRPLDRRRAGR